MDRPHSFPTGMSWELDQKSLPWTGARSQVAGVTGAHFTLPQVWAPNFPSVEMSLSFAWKFQVNYNDHCVL